jgi:hypothetical protein
LPHRDIARSCMCMCSKCMFFCTQHTPCMHRFVHRYKHQWVKH